MKIFLPIRLKEILKKVFLLLLFFSFGNVINAQNCQGHTLTMGGWGAPNTSNPNVSYLYTHFNNAFPNGVVLGCGQGYTLTLTSAQSITNFLPSGGTPSNLNSSYTNPSNYGNTLAGQLVAVMLAVGFDNYDQNFSVSNSKLGDFTFNSGSFQGMTVSQFLVLANDFMGGCGNFQHTAADFNIAATAINENFDEGTIDNGYLSCCNLEIQVSFDPIKCYGESTVVHVTATGGDGNVQGIGDFIKGAGEYTFTVTSGNCSKSVTITIEQPSLLISTISSTPILCYGGLSTLTANASGGTGSYSYLWSNGSTSQSIQVSAGTYSVIVTDVNMCSVTETIVVTQPTAINLTITKNDVVCVGGTASVYVDVSGGTLPYTYLWSNGATTASTNLLVGNHSVTVTDANGCSISESFEVKMLSCAGFTTVTQGGWGAKAAGNNWGKYRDMNFSLVFPSGITIGAAGNILKLTTAKAVDDFLPSGSTPRALNNGVLMNPGSNYKNVLAGQVVALTLNVGFDYANPSFSSSTTYLGNLVITSGIFSGFTVNQVLTEANNVLGGLSSIYTASQMNEIIDGINNNYDNGNVNLGLLACPCEFTQKTLVSSFAYNVNSDINSSLESAKVYPNPTKGDINLVIDVSINEDIAVNLYDVSGKLIDNLSKNSSRNQNQILINYSNYNLAEGMYFMILKASSFEKSYKIIVKK
ncbi:MULTISPECIES: T9SS type A sorting domain-containing protein [unclassified Flavobacterium]|uniref:T9SS type A sorting domain-containing protein n=1 Tax=unclassified Flavobacterium TaxID=196869 RepID=UPI0013CFC385|nr:MULTISPECIES: T9SS type A sorting domain-containing protein [unclassified Flavobacterium]MBA5792418.1 T9SS type A sorting domain-containing protein [Flavobacterium sp. xlx-221]